MLRLVAALGVGLLLATPIEAESGEFPSDLRKWIAVEPPEPQSDGWFAASQDIEHEWAVTVRDGRPRVEIRTLKADADGRLPFKIEVGSANEGLAGRRRSAKVADGWIVAFNAGEFGAGLWWFSPDGAKRYKIAEAWIEDLIPTDAGLLALEGLAHGFSSRGKILRLVPGASNRWQAEHFVDLKHAPEASTKQSDGSLLVATTGRLLRVLPAEKRVEVLVSDAFWDGLYPNSLIVAPDGSIYLGMRHGVARMRKAGGAYKMMWLLPDKRFLDVESTERFK